MIGYIIITFLLLETTAMHLPSTCPQFRAVEARFSACIHDKKDRTDTSICVLNKIDLVDLIGCAAIDIPIKVVHPGSAAAWSAEDVRHPDKNDDGRIVVKIKDILKHAASAARCAALTHLDQALECCPSFQPDFAACLCGLGVQNGHINNLQKCLRSNANLEDVLRPKQFECKDGSASPSIMKDKCGREGLKVSLIRWTLDHFLLTDTLKIGTDGQSPLTGKTQSHAPYCCKVRIPPAPFLG